MVQASSDGLHTRAHGARSKGALGSWEALHASDWVRMMRRTAPVHAAITTPPAPRAHTHALLQASASVDPLAMPPCRRLSRTAAAVTARGSATELSGLRERLLRF
mmetsp:Transcript_29127/g.61219  ORF Transcript_29127/g.61219 Transcript_29127/m.61219 type:complete len:105 (-) Transcript_29127:653-967(-)